MKGGESQMDFKKKDNIVFAAFCIALPVLLLNVFNLIEKRGDWNYFYNYHQILSQEHTILKNDISAYEDLIDKSKVNLNENKSKFDFIVPKKADISSMLIFLEEYALLDDVTVSKIDSQQDNAENQTHFGITYEPILVEAMGSYDNIMLFLSDIQNNMGIVNYIDEVSFQGANRNLIKWNKNDSHLDDENVIVNFKLYIGFSEKEGEDSEQ